MNTVKHTISTNLSIKFLLFVSFIEGAAVMIIELLGAKIIAPFYGTSMYVWASVLGVTLIALAGGYYGGGWISNRYRNKSPLFIILAVGALFTILAPKIAPAIMMATNDLGVRGGSFVSVLIYLLPSVVCMGMVSPIIIQQINQTSDNAGQSAGTVYAISTLGGILATFLAGFVLIPQMGIRTTASITGFILLALSVAGMFFFKQKRSVILIGVLCFLFIPYSYSKGQKSDPSVSVRYQSSGILGEWTVVDQVVVVQENGVPLSTRQLLLNGVDQTYTEVGNEPVSMWMYPHKLAALASIKPEKSNALLLGMGGGSIAHNLINLGFKLDIVELDDRVPYIAETYFGFNPKTANLVIDDARHFVRNSKSKYDIVVLDLVNGEVQPSHIFTQEGLKELRKVLNDDALVIINFQGRFDMEKPELSIGPRSVFKTFESVGYKMFVGKREASDEKNASADLLMYGTPSSLDFKAAFQDSLRYNKIFTFEKFLAEDFKPIGGFNLVDAQIMTDDQPNLELLNAPTILEWRKNKIKYTVDGLLKKGLPIYH